MKKVKNILNWNGIEKKVQNISWNRWDLQKKENILVYKCGSDIGICRLDKLDRLKYKIDKFLEEMGSNN